MFDTISAQDARRELDPALEELRDPNVVHINMLRGLIGRPSVAQIIHIYGADALLDAIRAELARGAEEKPLPRIEFHQQDWIPGFAAFLPGATTPSPDSKAFCVLNLASILSTVYHGDTAREDLPYFLADSIMHEVIHVLEQWAGVEFSEDRVDALVEKYRALSDQQNGGSDEHG